jgi:hypothetical protein
MGARARLAHPRKRSRRATRATVTTTDQARLEKVRRPGPHRRRSGRSAHLCAWSRRSRPIHSDPRSGPLMGRILAPAGRAREPPGATRDVSTGSAVRRAPNSDQRDFRAHKEALARVRQASAPDKGGHHAVDLSCPREQQRECRLARGPAPANRRPGGGESRRRSPASPSLPSAQLRSAMRRAAVTAAEERQVFDAARVRSVPMLQEWTCPGLRDT